ncbi:unnamed protein product [Microthlaspi erraticum]|uniref:Uncharacterized protein n=1 Tax=Microthlaspi erraticum TaxID=1685480 RepID=A0A6D2K5X3_9BRAS|nr:unnamed protein product [Microthlaspi erraticum]
MDKMVSKIKSLEKKVSGSSSKKKKSKAPTFPRSRSLLTTPRRLPAQEPHRALRPDAPARPPDSIESKQRKLNSIELSFEQPAPPRPRSHTHFDEEEEERSRKLDRVRNPVEWSAPDGRLPLQTTT